MDNYFDFIETNETVILTFYIAPNEKEIMTPELVDSKLLLYKTKIELFEPVSLLDIKKSKYKIEVFLKKKNPILWHSITGEKKVSIIKSDICYNDVSEKTTDMYDVLSDIYVKGDDDVKKAMKKSMIESNGTVLSTNWKEVSKKKVNPQ